MSYETDHRNTSAGSENREAHWDEDEETRRITVWNPKTGKKLSGNAGVFKKNLAKYLRTHPDWVVWTGHDKDSPKRKRYSEIEGANKRRQIDRLSLNDKTPLDGQNHLPTAASLWRSLLVVCSEKSILEEVGADSEDEEEEERQDNNNPYARCFPAVPYKAFNSVFVHGGLTSPAVG